MWFQNHRCTYVIKLAQVVDKWLQPHHNITKCPYSVLSTDQQQRSWSLDKNHANMFVDCFMFRRAPLKRYSVMLSRNHVWFLWIPKSCSQLLSYIRHWSCARLEVLAAKARSLAMQKTSSSCASAHRSDASYVESHCCSSRIFLSSSMFTARVSSFSWKSFGMSKPYYCVFLRAL